MKKQEFMGKYHISEESFEKTGLEWDELIDIYADYCKKQNELEPILNMVADTLRKDEKVHSIKQRLKNPEHLIEKIIRKKIKDPSRKVTIENYADQITELEELIENSRMEAEEKEEMRGRISILAGALARAATQVDPLLM